MLKLKIPDKEAIKQTNKTKTNKTNIAKKNQHWETEGNKNRLHSNRNRGESKNLTFCR